MHIITGSFRLFSIGKMQGRELELNKKIKVMDTSIASDSLHSLENAK